MKNISLDQIPQVICLVCGKSWDQDKVKGGHIHWLNGQRWLFTPDQKKRLFEEEKK